MCGDCYYEWIEEQGANADDVLAQFDARRRPRREDDMPQGGLWEPTADEDNAPPELHQTTWCTARAMEFIDEARDDDHRARRAGAAFHQPGRHDQDLDRERRVPRTHGQRVK